MTTDGGAIRIERLRKQFGAIEALKGIDVTIGSGRITAIAGPNGAGKSTLIRSILGLVRVRAGDGLIRLGGAAVNGDSAYRQSVGYMPQSPQFPERLTGREIVGLLRRLRGDPRDVDLELLEKLGLAPVLDRRVGDLSGGTRQKLNAAVAFLFRPDVLILDEPTAGLDPIASGVLKAKVRLAALAGSTVLLTSHIVSEIEELAQDLVFLIEGRVCYQGAVADLLAATGESRLEPAMASLLAGFQ